jgi:hypothetical protein
VKPTAADHKRIWGSKGGSEDPTNLAPLLTLSDYKYDYREIPALFQFEQKCLPKSIFKVN